MSDPDWSTNKERALWARGRDGTNAAAPDTTLTDEVSMFTLSQGLWTREVVSRGLRHVRTTSWPTEARELPAEAEYLARHDGHSEALLVTPGGTSATSLNLSEGSVHVRIAARTLGEVDEILEWMRREFPRVEYDPEEPRVPVTFWSLSNQGPTARTRQISVPGWCDIRPNYSDPVTDELLRLIGVGFAPGVGGQLLLWHGPPGTGKTWALRALAWEWRAWADLHYITDPETFFGDRASYMLDVLLHDQGEMVGPARRIGPDDDPHSTPAPAPVDPRAEGGRWKLLVLEDTGELMSADARERSGQGLSRLLNVVDGLIGQGLKVLVLVTTNEELKTLHPAVQRPGRCASKILFEPLNTAEAFEWLVSRGMDDEAANEATRGPRTVADLYAALEERQTSADRGRAAVGFAS